MDVVEYSESIKKTADNILHDTNLIKILSKFGEVIVGGSYKYNLMWGTDIDISVICKDPRKTSTSTLRKIIDLRLFQKHEYGDFAKFERPDRPKSYIINLWLPIENQKWEIEIWFFKELPENPTDELIKNKLNNKHKEKILQMKKQRDELGIDKHKISSLEIYQGVLLDNVNELEQLISNK